MYGLQRTSGRWRSSDDPLRHRGVFLIGLVLPAVLAVLLLSGCRRPQQPQSQAPPPPEVLVCRPVVRNVTDYEDFTGRTEARPSIEVRARVTGYLDKVFFKEGTEVKEGDRLFQIDPRTYQAEFDRTVANVVQAKARLSRLDADFKRAQSLLSKAAISQQDFDLVAGDRAEAAAGVGVADAAMHLAKENLDFTLVTASISGRISRQYIDPGNMVKADDTVLTTLVSLDPMYVYFDVDERTMLKFRRLLLAGKVKTAQEAKLPVFLGLADEQGFPHEGVIDFADNHLDPMTGTLRIRGQFPNPRRFLAPGMFARIRTPIGPPHQAIMISERALMSDQGQRYAYVVDEHNKVQYRPVTTGQLSQGLRVIESGLGSNDRVVLSGLQRVRKEMPVRPKEVAMSAAEATAEAPPAAKAK
jgi:RND family efflux transporter MFP subunit